MSDTHGKVWWTELMTRDLEAAQKYYGDTCGWSFESMEMPDQGGTYVLALLDGKPTAGMMDMTGMPGMNGVPPHWFSYFAVDDVDRAASDTAAAGGRVQREPWDIPGTGRIAILEDPTGAMMGLMTPEPMPG